MKIVTKGIFNKAQPAKPASTGGLKVVPLGVFKAPEAPKSGLKILSGLKDDVSLKLMIHKALAGWEKARDPKVLHASDLMRPEGEFCPREHAFLMMGTAKKKDQFLGTAMKITYEHGRDIENHLRNTWLRQHIVGNWRCGVCGHLSDFGKAPKVKCPKCGWGHQWKYEEVRFESPTSGISCGIDALVEVGKPKFRITEVKTMAIDQFKKLEAPLPEHRFRTSLYMKLVEESTMPHSAKINTKEAHLLYVAKSFGVKDEDMKAAGIADAQFSPFKEFIIPRNDDIVTTQVNKAIALKAWRDTPEVGLPCGVCLNGLTKRAQKCAAVGACWSGSYTAVITWMEDGKPRHPGKKLVSP